MFRWSRKSKRGGSKSGGSEPPSPALVQSKTTKPIRSQPASALLHSLLNLNIWQESERSKFDNFAVRDAIKSNSHAAAIKQTFKLNGGTNLYPLAMACALGASSDVVQLMIDACPAAVRDRDKGGWTPLHYGCRFDASPSAIRILLNNDPDGTRRKTHKGWTPLHLACWNQTRSVDVIRTLIQHCSNALRETDCDGWTPLHFACRYGASATVVGLLMDGFPGAVDLTSVEGKTPLYLARQYNASNVVMDLLGGTRQATARQLTGKTTGDAATTGSSVEMQDLHSLLDLSPLSQRSKYNNIAVREALRADPSAAKRAYNFKVGWGNVYPIFLATSLGASVDVIEMFCNACPESIKEKDENGWTLLHYACRFHSSNDVLRLLVYWLPQKLLAWKERVSGSTPLHLLVASEMKVPEEAVRILVKSCPSAVEVTNKWGKTPHMIAEERSASPEILALLMPKGDGISQNPTAANVAPDGRKQNKQNKQDLHSLLDLFPSEKLKFDDGAVQRAIQRNPHHARQKYRFKVDWGDIYPLSMAVVLSASLASVELLVDACPDALEHVDWQGRTPLALAQQHRAPPEVISFLQKKHKLLVKRPTPIKQPPDLYSLLDLFPSEKSKFNDGAVRRAIQQSPHDARQKYRFKVDWGDIYPLSMAVVLSASLASVELLVDACPDALEHKDWQGRTALTLAQQHRAPPEVISFLQKRSKEDNLLSNCPPPNKKPANLHSLLDLSPMSERSKFNNASVREAMQSNPGAARVAFDFKVGWGRIFPIFLAVSLGASADVVELFCDASPESVRAKDKDGWTPLHYACRFKTPVNVVSLLVRKHPGALSEKDAATDSTPLHLACETDAPTDVIRLLVKGSPESVKEKDRRGRTPLMLAKQRDASATLLELLTEEPPDEKPPAARPVGPTSAAVPLQKISLPQRFPNEQKPKKAASKTTIVAQQKGKEEKRKMLSGGPDVVKSRQKLEIALNKLSEPVLVSLEYVLFCTNGFADKVGEGAFGEVFLGTDRVLKRKFAVKSARLNVLGAEDDHLKQICLSFKRNLSTLRLVKHHPNISYLYGYYFADDLRGPKCMLFEYAERGALDQFLKSTDGREELDWMIRINIALDVAKALNYLHKEGLGFECFHRDVKPANICLKSDFTAQLIDCGLSKIVAEDKSSLGVSVASGTCGLVVGTPGYICPYYAGGKKEYESACDVFSLGIVLTELFRGFVQLTEIDGEKLDLYEVYSPDEDEEDLESDADELAGEWEVDARRKFASLAVKCLARKPKPRPKIENIVTALRQLAREHCKLTASEKALKQCEEMLASKSATCESHEEIVERRCPECMLGSLPSLTCHNSSEPHVFCLMCFQRYVERHVGDEAIRCPVAGCNGREFTDEEILRYTDINIFAHHINIRYQRKQHQQHMEFLNKLSKVEAGLDKIDSKMDHLSNQLDHSMGLLATLAGGKTSPCPKLAVMVPLNAPAAFKKWMKAPGKRRILVYFVCAHSFTLVEPPMELYVTKSWVKKAAPFLKTCLVLLQAAVITLKICTGFSIPMPHPGLVDASKQLQALDDVLEDAMDKDVQEILGDTRTLLGIAQGGKNSRVVGGLPISDQNPKVTELVGKAYKAIAEEANKLQNFDWKRSMTPVLSKNREILWVKNEFADEVGASK